MPHIPEAVKSFFSDEEQKHQKEQFDSSLKDKELVTQIDAWLLESNDFYSMLKEIWTQNIEYYIGQQTQLELVRGKDSKAVENRIFMATETMIPIATSRLPDIEVRAGSEDEKDQMEADELKDVIGFQFERIGMQELSERYLRNMILKRYGVFKAEWNKEKDDVDLHVIDPRRIRIPRLGLSVQDLAYVIEELEMSYESIKKFFGEEKAKEVLKENPKTEKDGDNNVKKRKATFSILEVWTNTFTVWKIGDIILKSEKNRYWKEDKKDNFFDSPRKPYIIKSLFQTEEGIIGDTDYIQQMISIQDNINIKKRQIENVGNKVANPILLVDSDVMSEEQAANITNEPGLILYGKDAADGSKVRFEAPGQLPNYIFLDLEGSRSAFDNIWGIHSTTRGERQGKETLGGRQLLKAADLGRIDLVARQLERSLDEVAEWFTQLIKLFYTEEKAFSIIGEDGTRFIEKFSQAKVGENVKPMVVAGSTLPKDEVSLRQEAIELWQLKAIGLRTLYKKLKMSNIPDAIDDYAETVSGRIAQQGAAPPGGTQPPTQVPPVEPQV